MLLGVSNTIAAQLRTPWHMIFLKSGFLDPDLWRGRLRADHPPDDPDQDDEDEDAAHGAADS